MVRTAVLIIIDQVQTFYFRPKKSIGQHFLPILFGPYKVLDIWSEPILVGSVRYIFTVLIPYICNVRTTYPNEAEGAPVACRELKHQTGTV